MNLTTRRVIMLAFISAFIITAPLLILYTSGYRYNFKKRQMIKTGLLFIKNKPKDVEIYLDGQLQKKEAFINTGYNRVTDLVPKDYLIEVKKEGYLTWSKYLPILANQTTFAKSVLLFKKTTPWPIVNGQIKQLKISPDKNYLAIIISNQPQDKLYLYSLNTNNHNYLTLENIKGQINNLEWSPTGKKIILETSEDTFVLDIENQATLALKNIIFDNLHSNKKTFKLVKWHETNDNVLYGAIDQNLYEINTFLHAMKALKTNVNISDYLIKNNQLLILDNSGPNKSRLIQSNLRALDQNNRIITLPQASQYRFIDTRSDYLNLLDEQNQILYLFDYQKNDFDSPEEIINGVKEAVWFYDNNWLLYVNDFEIWIYKKEENNKILLTRMSKKIDTANWLNNYPYVIFATDNKIKAIEEDGRDRRNIFELSSLDSIQQLIMDEKGNNLFFSGKINEIEGVFILNIRED